MIDTHAHIYEEKFDADRDEMIARARMAGVRKILVPCTCVGDMERVAELCRQYPDVCHAMYGLHPTEMGADPMSEAREILEFATKQESFVGVGEIGLDLYWDKSRKEEQVEVFLWQMEWAYDNQKPVSIHCRDAVWLLMEVLPRLGNKIPAGSLHCFAGSTDEAKVIAKKYPQFMFGFGGSSTYKNSKVAEVATVVPTDRILTETDSPYLTPVPYRGKRNEPSYVPLVVARLATELNISPDDLADITDSNAQRLFL